jgi:choline monooxygenase
MQTGRARMLTPSADFYLSASQFAAELRNVFARSWQLVGHAGQLANPGDYFTTHLGKEPLLFVNDGGTLRGFFNVCRHRAGPVAQGCGNARRLACRYHGWTYSLAGQLLSAGEMDGAPDFAIDSIRLQNVAVHRFGPLLFARLASDPVESAALAFDREYAGLTDRCAALGLERMRHVATREYPVNANWKVYVDNYLEGYHIPLVHPALNRELDYRQYETELSERYVLQSAPVRSDTAKHYSANAANGQATNGQAWYYWLFPNTMLNIYENQLQTNIVVPLDENRTIVRFDWFAFEPLPDPQSDTRWLELVRFSEQIQAEDAAICSTVHGNLASIAYRSGPYSPKRESGLRLFHTLMRNPQ